MQAHFGLSSLENWNDIENCDFDYGLFFKNCVRLLKDTPEDGWVVNTLKFLTRYIFSVVNKLLVFHVPYSQLPSMTRKRKRAHNDIRDHDQGEDTTSRILAMRAERNVRRDHDSEEENIYQVSSHLSMGLYRDCRKSRMKTCCPASNTVTDHHYRLHHRRVDHHYRLHHRRMDPLHHAIHLLLPDFLWISFNSNFKNIWLLEDLEGIWFNVFRLKSIPSLRLSVLLLPDLADVLWFDVFLHQSNHQSRHLLHYIIHLVGHLLYLLLSTPHSETSKPPYHLGSRRRLLHAQTDYQSDQPKMVRRRRSLLKRKNRSSRNDAKEKGRCLERRIGMAGKQFIRQWLAAFFFFL